MSATDHMRAMLDAMMGTARNGEFLPHFCMEKKRKNRKFGYFILKMIIININML